MLDRRSFARQLGLLGVVFVATLVLLAGGMAFLSRGGPARPSGSASASPAVVPSPPASFPGASQSGGSGQPTGGASGDLTAVLIGAGDIADCSLDGVRQTSDLMLGLAGSVFTAGDNVYPDGSAQDFTNCYGPTWGRLLDRTILPTAGNHDWNTDGASGYRAYFGAAATPAGTTWYSRDVGAWHVVVLDSNCAMIGGCDAASEQGRWLARDLADDSARCTLALWHHPRFSSGQHGNEPLVDPFWTQLHAAGVDLVVNGHDHDYERFAPLDASGNVQRPGGMRQIVAGTGGATLRPFHTLATGSEFRLAGSWGVLRLTLRPVNYEWEFLPVTGTITDAGSTPCH